MGARPRPFLQLRSVQWSFLRYYAAPSYSTPAPVGVSLAEVRSAKEYCSGLLQYV